MRSRMIRVNVLASRLGGWETGRPAALMIRLASASDDVWMARLTRTD
jgi:hypothetical protein